MARNLLATPKGRNLLAVTEEEPKPLNVFQQQAEDIGSLQTGVISAGQGLFNIGRAIGLVDPATDTERKTFQALAQQKPISSFVGQAAGESLPFVPLGALYVPKSINSLLSIQDKG